MSAASQTELSVSNKPSYRQILRSSSIIGGASVINVLVGLLRGKASALLLGPTGVGVIGLLQNMMATASQLSALGFSNVGTRQVAEGVRDGPDKLAAARRALFWGTVTLGLLGALAFWLLREVLARRILRDPGAAGQVGMLAVGVALTVAAGSQTALLNGMRRIGDLARVNVFSAVLASCLGVGALVLWGHSGLLLFVLATPLASFSVGYWFARRVTPVGQAKTPMSELWKQWDAMVRMGTAFMLGGLVMSAGQLLVRTIVQRDLGPAALGQFQASWTISTTYIGFVLSSMGTDYYPRLTAAMKEPQTVSRLVNEQTEVALLLGGPVFLLMLGFAPWIVHLLYSSAFDESVRVLRWQVLGDVLKVMTWPLGFVVLAAGHGRFFMFTQTLAIGTLALFTWLAVPKLGIVATGMGYLCMYVLLLPVNHAFAVRRIGFRWERTVLLHLVLFAGCACAVFAAASASTGAGAVLGGLLGVGMGMFSLTRLAHMANIGGRAGKLAAGVRRAMAKIRQRVSRH